ncbi:MAG: aldo/keto reductase [Planctomycetota bacterium]
MIERRGFLRSLMGLTAGLAVGRGPLSAQAQGVVGALAGPPTGDRLGKLLPMRRLGRTNEWVTSLCLGGSHIEYRGQVSLRDAQEIIELSLEEGVRFFDNAQQYGDGEAERRFGHFLTPKYRDVIYLMSKTQATTRKQAERDMDECRQRMNVDVIDLMQVHHIHSPEDVDQRIEAGVVDVLLEAQRAGKIRHLGFTGHDTPRAHLHMLKRLDAMGLKFDTVQMPMNVVDPSYESFIVEVMPELLKRDIGVLAMKTLVFGQLVGANEGWNLRNKIAPKVVPEQMTLAEALGFVWSLPVSTIVSGMRTTAMVRENAALARAHVDLAEDHRLALVDKAAAFAGPDTEFYKDRI